MTERHAAHTQRKRLRCASDIHKYSIVNSPIKRDLRFAATGLPGLEGSEVLAALRI
jgi:hypothetical protein